MLHAAARNEIEHWYLEEQGDYRSSFALEVPANEYSCQGLELDFSGVCWGGDFVIGTAKGKAQWQARSLGPKNWNKVNKPENQKYVSNSYRVLLTRAREGMVIWVPEGDAHDRTRAPGDLDATADFLIRCGAIEITMDQNGRVEKEAQAA
jgi:DUF2075 family protein